MRRIFIDKSLAIFILIGAFVFMSACSSKADIPKEYDYADLSEYIKLGEYKGIEYTKITGDVSDDEIKAYVDSIVSSSDESVNIEEGVVGEDSIVNINFVGTVDGVEFDGGSAENVELSIRNSGYIPGFAEGLVGHEVGETFDLNVTFPESYGNKELAGKPAVFRMTVNSLVVKKKAVFDDDWVSRNTDYETTDEYSEYVRNLLSENKLSTAESDEKREVFNSILESSEVVDYPEKELEARTLQIKKMYEEYAKNSGTTLDDFVTNQMGMTSDDFNSIVDQTAKETVRQELLMQAIRRAENLDVSKAGYDEFLQNILKKAGLTEKSFEEQNGKSIFEYASDNNLFTSYLYDVVMKKVMEYSVGK